MKICTKCGAELTDENWYPSCRATGNYICKDCQIVVSKAYYKEHKVERNAARRKNYYVHGVKPLSENKKCSSFFGIHIAERVLSHVFKNVKRMPNNHKGYDVICNGGYMIDIKSSCRHVSDKRSDHWLFHIKRNTIADHFLCLAFDNRESLNPEHIWLIPGKDVNDKDGIGISETTLKKWKQYKLNKIDQITQCCNTMRGD